MDPGFNIRDFLELESMSESEIDRCEFWVNANRITRESGKENWKESRIPVNNNWDLNTFEKWLDRYEDTRIIQYLRYGWPLNAHDTSINTTVPPNQAGARQHPEEIRSYLKSELQAGSIIGPFKRNPFGKHARFSPLDTRPKRDSEELRVILNLSYPFKGNSVNRSIGKEIYDEEDNMTLRYPSVDDLAKLIRKKGRRAKIMKRDLSKAYRQLFMSPNSIHLLGYRFENLLYFDVTLSMGSKSAAYCCQRTTNAITYVYNKHGYEDVNYLDDLGAAEEESKAEEAYDCLGWILDTIGIKESKKKACPPAFIAVFLGILFNTLTMTMEITKDRMVEIRNILEEWESKQKATLREVQVLLGKLNFAASTIRAGRIFISRLINSLKEFPDNGYKKIDENMKKDILWWKRFMGDFDGISIMPPIKWDAPDTIMQTDSCLDACGGFSQGEAFTTRFPKWIKSNKEIHINELELLAIIVAVRIWKDKLENRNVLAFCDNEVSVEVVNSGRACNRFAQSCLRELCYLNATNNAVIKLIHLPGSENRIADCLSRWGKQEKRQEFEELTKGAEISFTEVTEEHFRFTNKW